MPVTLKELAARAGVHPSTISRVVNRDPGLRIAPETRARIEALIAETRYRPNGIARSLKLRQTFVVAVIIPDVTNPLFAGIFRGVEDVALTRGYNVILCNTDNLHEREASHLESLHARRVDGVILASATLADPSVARLRQLRIPFVLVNRYSDTRHAFVGSDDVAGGRLATAHLLSLGHRRIAHLAGSQKVSTSLLRRRGYLEALEQAGVEPDPALIVDGGFTEDLGARAMERLLALSRPPTAVFAVNDMAAAGAQDVLVRRGLRIPKDVSIVGYNDVPLVSRLHPPLTTVRVPPVRFGQASAEILFEQLETGTASSRRVVFQPELVIRASTGPPG
ncbi:MAG TPA: LacI family DNA-binding transcriptional regulator [Candidatus Dormibacteraeota bacterium]|nr:LacI family DNA-binding transcriptional regulator [Candidatus Dormibacteraeota bacterium]